MLDRRVIREQPDRVRRSLARRQLPVSVVDDFLALDADWRTAVTAVDSAKAQRNQISADFAKAKGASSDVLERLREQSLALGERIASQEQAAASLDQRIDELLANVPNLLADDVPVGQEDDPAGQGGSAGSLRPRSAGPEHEAELLRQIVDPLEKPLLGDRAEALVELAHPTGGGVQFEKVEVRQTREDLR